MVNIAAVLHRVNKVVGPACGPPKVKVTEDEYDRQSEAAESEDDTGEEFGTNLCCGLLWVELAIFLFRIVCCILVLTGVGWFALNQPCYDDNNHNRQTRGEQNATKQHTFQLTNLSSLAHKQMQNGIDFADSTLLLHNQSSTHVWIYVLHDCFYFPYSLRSFISIWEFCLPLRLVPVLFFCIAHEKIFGYVTDQQNSTLGKLVFIALATVLWILYIAFSVWDVWVSTQLTRASATGYLVTVSITAFLWILQACRNWFCPKTYRYGWQHKC